MKKTQIEYKQLKTQNINNKQKLGHLAKLAKENNLPHALLVSGVSADEFVFQIFGKDIKKTTPNFLLVEPIKKRIQVDQIREILWRFSLKSAGDSYKVVVIDQAHLMNQEAQTCLLKTLEEPKGNSLIVLITEHPALLFETILSRVQKIKFKRQVVDPEQKLLDEIARVANSDLACRLRYAEKIAKEPSLPDILTAWLHYLRQDIVKNKQAIQSFLGVYYLILKTNVNKRLALENLMLEL